MNRKFGIHALSAVFCCVLQLFTLPVTAQDVYLEDDCKAKIDGFVIFYGNCTCRKSDPQQEGFVQWYFTNGSIPRQIRNNAGSSSILDVRQPYTHAKNATYTCSVVSSSGAVGPGVRYFSKFSYGPDTAEIILSEEEGPFCPVVNRTATVYCIVYAESVYPEPKFRVDFDSQVTADIDRPAQFVEESNLWRLKKRYTPKEAGLHTLSCYALNTHFGELIKMSLNLEVQAPPPPPGLQLGDQTFQGMTGNVLETEDGHVWGITCVPIPQHGFRQLGMTVHCEGMTSSADDVMSAQMTHGETCECTVYYRQHQSGCEVMAKTAVVVTVAGQTQV